MLNMTTELYDDQSLSNDSGMFTRSPALDLLNYNQMSTPAKYRDHILDKATSYFFGEPIATLKFLETLIPNNNQRNFLLSFIRTKLTTFKHSSTILYFHGVHNSGDDILMNILRRIINTTDNHIDGVIMPSKALFFAPIDNWLLDSSSAVYDFVQLDGFGETLYSAQAHNLIKAYTTEKKVLIRAIHKDATEHTNFATFVLTGNHEDPVAFTDTDKFATRRVAFIETPNKLAMNQEWVDTIYDEVMDFSFYLANNVENLTEMDYTEVPEQLKLI